MKFITNQGVRDESEYGMEYFIAENSVYEVIRIIDGIPLFCEDHFVRLKSSMEIRKIPFEMEFTDFRQKITWLVRLNQILNGNIKFVYFGSGVNIHWAFTFIPHSYPTPVEYQDGVSVDLLFAERQNPNAKVVQAGIRDEANQMISTRKLYEVLLVNGAGMITEGSRSNVFFVKGEVFYTAPASEVLIGITRQKVIGCFAELGLKIVETAVLASDIESYDAVFLTGTSPKILPIRFIGKYEFNTKLVVIRKLMDHYNNMIDQYIKTHISSNQDQ